MLDLVCSRPPQGRASQHNGDGRPGCEKSRPALIAQRSPRLNRVTQATEMQQQVFAPDRIGIVGNPPNWRTT